MNEQEIIVGIIILVCVVWIVRRTILCIKRISRKENPCEGCPCGCSMNKHSCPNEKNSDSIEIFLVNACRFKKRLYLCNRNRETTIASEK